MLVLTASKVPSWGRRWVHRCAGLHNLTCLFVNDVSRQFMTAKEQDVGLVRRQRCALLGEKMEAGARAKSVCTISGTEQLYIVPISLLWPYPAWKLDLCRAHNRARESLLRAECCPWWRQWCPPGCCGCCLRVGVEDPKLDQASSDVVQGLRQGLLQVQKTHCCLDCTQGAHLVVNECASSVQRTSDVCGLGQEAETWSAQR